jgi:hypothetical protein
MATVQGADPSSDTPDTGRACRRHAMPRARALGDLNGGGLLGSRPAAPQEGPQNTRVELRGLRQSLPSQTSSAPTLRSTRSQQAKTDRPQNVRVCWHQTLLLSHTATRAHVIRQRLNQDTCSHTRGQS